MIESFRGPYRFLSNFAPVPHGIVLDGHVFPTVEHAYQAAKTDSAGFERMIAEAPAPGLAKKIGARAPLRPGWEQERLVVMYSLLRQKFAPGSGLAACLQGTGDVLLVEGNAWGDRFWGVSGGFGENYLGRLLMIVRAEISTP